MRDGGREAGGIVFVSIYRLDCHACGETVTLPAVDGPAKCPLCGAALDIHWAGEAQRIAEKVRANAE